MFVATLPESFILGVTFECNTLDNSEACFLVDDPGLPHKPVLESFCFASGFVWLAILSLWQGLMLFDDK